MRSAAAHPSQTGGQSTSSGWQGSRGGRKSAAGAPAAAARTAASHSRRAPQRGCRRLLLPVQALPPTSTMSAYLVSLNSAARCARWPSSCMTTCPDKPDQAFQHHAVRCARCGPSARIMTCPGTSSGVEQHGQGRRATAPAFSIASQRTPPSTTPGACRRSQRRGATEGMPTSLPRTRGVVTSGGCAWPACSEAMYQTLCFTGKLWVRSGAGWVLDRHRDACARAPHAPWSVAWQRGRLLLGAVHWCCVVGGCPASALAPLALLGCANNCPGRPCQTLRHGNNLAVPAL